MGKAMGVKLNSMLKTCEGSVLGKAEKAGAREMSVSQSKIEDNILTLVSLLQHDLVAKSIGY